ncbi:MAG: hypothetical protein EOO56_10405 [Hymenobacter sp.]|nr:MAG: hypothetical protein EOO56_10405 [Hymenobacter sp.]
MITIEFGEPKHGWLPVALRTSAFELEFYASDVPVNPLESLCEALAVVPFGGSAKVMWHLEPAVYWFAFEKQAEEASLLVIESPLYNKSGTCILRLTGSVRDILLPFHKALAEFASHQFSEKHWPSLAESRIKRLGQVLRSQH